MDKAWTYQYHVVELATKWATPYVHEELSVARVCRPHGECVKQNVVRVHRHGLSIQDVHLSIADCEKVAFHISRARCLSIDLKEPTVVSVYKLDAAAVHCCVRHGTKVDKQPKIVVCIEHCEGHFAGNVFIYRGYVPPQILSLGSVVVDLVWRTVNRDSHFGDVRVNVFFRVSGAGGVGLDKEQTTALKRQALRVHSDVEPVVRGFCKGYLFSHDMILCKVLAAVVHGGCHVCQFFAVDGLIL